MAWAGVGRRGVLRGGVAAALLFVAGCGGGAPEVRVSEGDRAPPTIVADLSALLPRAGLRWAVLARPRDVSQVPWLAGPIERVASSRNLEAFAARTGIDLRLVPEAVVASYAGSDGEEGATAYVVRHTADPVVVERLFRERITGDFARAVERPDLVRVSGTIGTVPVAFARLGRDVVVFQVGGKPKRGPARIASLMALGKLGKVPTLFSGGPLEALRERFGSAPVQAFALGPFEGELARGARGLLSGATALGASARPSAREGIAVSVAVAGDFSESGPEAETELLAAWRDLAQSSFGRLLGLDAPVDEPLATHAPDAVAVAVELPAERLSRGLAAATGAEVEEIMR